MAISVASIFKTTFYTLALSGGLYLLFVFALIFPTVQRNALYAHKVNPTAWQDLSDVEAFGFLPYQIQPFVLRTPDNETLYAWHMLPLNLAEAHSQELTAQGNHQIKTSETVHDTQAFNLLTSDPNAHVVLNFHGNAGHLASSYRPFTYQRFLGLSSKARPVHVIAFDYRGFGLSTGTPTEEGLVTDAETMLGFLTGLTPSPSSSETPSKPDHYPDPAHPDHNPPYLSIPPSKIILTSQSLGTAISASLLHRWTLLYSLPPPKTLILTSAFSSLASLIDSYSIKGVVPPLLSPFRSYPFIMNKITSHLADTWRTDTKLSQLLAASDRDRDSARLDHLPIHIELLHAKDDREIPWWETQRLWDSVMLHFKGTATATSIEGTNTNNEAIMEQHVLTNEKDRDSKSNHKSENATGPHHQRPHIQTWHNQHHPTTKSLRFTLTSHGGHNRLACSEHAAAAVWRALER